MPENWTVVYSTSEIYEADLVKWMLGENEIESITMNKMDSLYSFGEIEILVPAELSFQAKQIILNFQNE